MSDGRIDLGQMFSGSAQAALSLKHVDDAAKAAAAAVTAFKQAALDAKKPLGPLTEEESRAASELEKLETAAKEATEAVNKHREATTAAKEATDAWATAGKRNADAVAARQKAAEDAARGLASATVAVAAAITALGVATIAGAIADERHQQALRALGPAYQEVQRATEGTVTASEAWQLQQRLLQSGLPTTGRELAEVTRAARDYARATGTETPAAIEQLSQALINGEAGGLRRFGIAVEQGATRTQTFESALRQLNATQLHTAPATRTLAEEVAHLQTILTEGGGALAGFLSQALGLPDAIEAIGQSVHRNAAALTDFVDFMGRDASNGSTGAVRGLIGGVRPSRRAAAGPTEAQAAIIAEGEAQGQRAAQSAMERANAPASGGGGGVSEIALRGADRIALLAHEHAAQSALEATAKARTAAEIALAAQLDASGTAEKNLTVARAIAAHDLVDTERQGREASLALARDRIDAEQALQTAEGHGDDARRERVGELANLRTALQGLLAETTARIEAAQSEHASTESINALLRERIGLQQSLTRTTTELAETQRNNVASLTQFRDAMVAQASGVADAFGAATAAAIDGQVSFGAALQAALRDQLKALTKESVVMVLKNLALGTAAIFTNPPAAPAFFASAGLWGAVGAAAGLGAAAIPAAPARPTAAPAGASAGAATASPARVTGESAGPLTLVVNVSGALFNEGVQESIVRGLDAAHARGLSPRFARV